jgi:hypothetical protein
MGIVRRKCSKHFVSIVWIRHEGVVIQVYFVSLHVRYIDGAKQWSDIPRERNLGRLFMFALLFYHMFSSICIVAYLVDCAAGINGAAPKFLLNLLHHTDTVRYFAKSSSEPRV